MDIPYGGIPRALEDTENFIYWHKCSGYKQTQKPGRALDSAANKQAFFSGKLRGRGRGRIKPGAFLSAVALGYTAFTQLRCHYYHSQHHMGWASRQKG